MIQGSKLEWSARTFQSYMQLSCLLILILYHASPALCFPDNSIDVVGWSSVVNVGSIVGIGEGVESGVEVLRVENR